MERAGTGIERIKNFCKDNGNKVKFDFDSSCFFTIISKKDKVETNLKSSEKTREKTREKILSLIEKDKQITQIEIASKIGISIKGVEWNLKNMKQEGLIKRIGPDKGGYWEIK